MRFFANMCILVVDASMFNQIFTEDLIVKDEGFYQELRFEYHAENSGITDAWKRPEDIPVILGQVDTGSCNSVVPLVICFKNCTSPDKYSMLPPKGDKDYDKPYSHFQLTAGLKPHSYLSAEFQTVQISDKIYLRNDRGQYDEIPVLIEGVVQSLTTYEFSAIIGLCPQNQQNGDRYYSDHSPEAAKVGDPRFLQRNTLAWDIKHIMERIYWVDGPNSQYNMFSIYLDPSDIHHKSTIKYGDIHPQFYNKPIVYFQNYQKPYNQTAGEYPSDKWKVEVTQIKQGDTKIVDNNKQSSQDREIEFVLFDTGCTYHKAPKAFIDKIIHLAGLKVVDEGETQITECTPKQYEKLGPLYFHSQGKVITLAKVQWVKFSEKRQLCAIMIGGLPENWKGHFILGFNFFKQHYTVFDNQDNEIGVYNLEDYEVSDESDEEDYEVSDESDEEEQEYQTADLDLDMYDVLPKQDEKAYKIAANVDIGPFLNL